jgi:hypothetical protein
MARDDASFYEYLTNLFSHLSLVLILIIQPAEKPSTGSSQSQGFHFLATQKTKGRSLPEAAFSMLRSTQHVERSTS